MTDESPDGVAYAIFVEQIDPFDPAMSAYLDLWATEYAERNADYDYDDEY